MVFLLVLGGIILLFGLGFVVMCIGMMAQGVFNGFNADTNRIIFACAIAAVILGTILVVHSIKRIKARRDGIQKQPIERPKKKLGKKGKTVLICVCGYVVLMGVIGVVLNISRSNREKDFELYVRPKIQSEYSMTGAEMPQSPKYIVYDAEKDKFIDKESGYPGHNYTRDPQKANVVVCIKKGCKNIGHWTSANSMVTIAAAYSEYYTVSIVRLDDWALIAEGTFDHEKNNTYLEEYTYTIKAGDRLICDFIDEYLD